eukprot:UN03934
MFLQILSSIIFSSLIVQSVDNALFNAVNDNDVKTLETLLNSGSDINTIGPGEQTPLMFAVLGGKLESVKYLLSKGADTSIAEKDGYTPMHGAGFQGRYEIAKELIKHGLDPRDKHKDGYEAIHRACWGQEQRHMETVKVLIENGVPYDAKAANGNTPLSMAKPGSYVYKYLTGLQREL